MVSPGSLSLGSLVSPGSPSLGSLVCRQPGLRSEAREMRGLDLRGLEFGNMSPRSGRGTCQFGDGVPRPRR